MMRKFIVRGLSLLVLLACILSMRRAAADPAVREVVTYLLVLAYLYVAPLLWSSSPDLFAPPVITGILACVATIGTVAGFLVEGQVKLDIIKGLDPDETRDLSLRVIAASVLALATYYLGYYASIGRALRDKLPRLQGLAWDPGRVRLVTILTLLVFLVSYAVFQRHVGGSLLDITRLDVGKKAWRDDPTLSWMVRGIQLGFLPVLLYLTWQCERRDTARLIPWALVLAAVSFLVSRMGQRGMFMTVILCALIIVHYLYRRIPATMLVGALYLGIVVSNILYQWRTTWDTGEGLSLMQAMARPVDVLVTHDDERQRFSSMALIMKEIPEQKQYLLGESWMAILVMPVPRWVWPAKPKHFIWRDTRIIENLGGGPIPASYPGTLYANFSWLGVAVGMFLWGVFHRALYEWMLQSGRDKNVVLLYAVVLLWFGPTMLALGMAMQYVLPIYVLLRFISRQPATRAVGEEATAKA